MTPLENLIGKRLRIFDGAGCGTVMGEGEVIAICFAPSITLQHDDGTRSHHSSDLPREVVNERPAGPDSCSQCGQRTPVCADCGDSIIFVPKSGFGNAGEWQHLAPPQRHVNGHLPRPRVFVS